MEGKASDWRPGPTVCRCCLSEGCYKDISTEYFWMGKREVYEEMLTETLNISISFSKSGGPNSNSRLICEPCIARLRDATEFKRQVIDCEKTFMHHLDPGSSSSRVTVQTIGDVKVELVKREKDTSDDDFDDRPDFLDVDSDDDLDNQPLTKLASKVPKKEAVDILDLLDNSQITVKRKATLKIKEAPPKKLKKKEVVVKPSASKPAPAKKPTEKKKGTAASRIIWKKQRYGDERDNAAIILECSNVCPFRSGYGIFKCALCSETFVKFPQLRDHTDKKHSNRIEALRSVGKNMLKCDITDLRCQLCLENKKNLEDLLDHLKILHGKPFLEDLGLNVCTYQLMTEGYYHCTHCTETFLRFYDLEKHMNNHYPKSVCPHCGKVFKESHNLAKHLKRHKLGEKGHYKCPKCDEIFTNAHDRSNHLVSVKHSSKRHRCPLCNDSFKDYPTRLEHLREVHGSKIEYPCSLCSAVFKQSSPRSRHIQQVHMKVKKFFCAECSYGSFNKKGMQEHMLTHSGEKKYKCQVCKKAYGRAYTLKEHMRIHNNDRRFVCMCCGSAFVQKCSLKNHMRTHHPDCKTDNTETE